MLDPFPGFTQNSWLERVRENARQFFAGARAGHSSANGAPIHLLEFGKSPRAGRAQSASVLAHVTILGCLVLLALWPARIVTVDLNGTTVVRSLAEPPGLMAFLRKANSTSGRGAGGDQNPIPATRGPLPPVSSIQLVRPSLPEHRESQLPVPPTALDPNAPPVLTPVDKIGLPWMATETDSPGPGKGHTIGSGDGSTAGDSGGDGPGGNGETNGVYKPGMTLPVCAYCPNPQFTDEARESKLQGTITLQVLVGVDGRASQVRVVHGMGMGLDERSIETVRGWHFIPGRDASRRAVPVWVTVEAVFRLF